MEIYILFWIFCLKIFIEITTYAVWDDMKQKGMIE